QSPQLAGPIEIHQQQTRTGRLVVPTEAGQIEISLVELAVLGEEPVDLLAVLERGAPDRPVEGLEEMTIALESELSRVLRLMNQRIERPLGRVTLVGIDAPVVRFDPGLT